MPELNLTKPKDITVPDTPDTSEEVVGTFDIEEDEIDNPVVGTFEVEESEMPLPGGGTVGTQTFMKEAEDTPASIWDKAKNLMHDPDQEGAKAVQALVDAESFGVRPNEALRYRDVIERGVKINPQAASRQSDISDRVNQSWEIGKKQNFIGEIGYQYILTGDPKYLERIKSVGMPSEGETFISESRLEDAVRSAAKLMPMVIDTGTESIGKGMKVGMGFGLIATVLGQAGPQAALPEEVITVPAATLAGFKIGATSGAFESSLRKEAGLALSKIITFKDKEGNEIDPKIARATAYGIGAINAGIEVVQLRLLLNTIPGMSKLFSESMMEVVAGKAVKDKLLALAGKYAGTVAAETAQEIAQESTNIVFEELAKKVNNKALDTDIEQTDIKTALSRLKQTMVESAQGFAVIALPGTIAQAAMVKGEKAPGVVPDVEAKPGKVVEPAEDITIEKTIDEDFDRVMSIEEADLDAEIDTILDTIEKEDVLEPDAIEIGPKAQAFKDQIYQVVDKEEATAVTTLLDARAKAVGMTTDEYIDYHGLEVVSDGVAAEGDLAQTQGKESDFFGNEEYEIITHSGGKIKEIEGGGVFNGIFGKYGDSSSGGLSDENNQTTFAIKKDRIARKGDVDLDYEKSINFIKNEYPEASEDQIEKFYEWIAEDESVFDNATDEDIKEFGFSDLDIGEASWHAQRLRGEIAKDQGFDAIEMDDETGTSILIPYGSKATVVSRDYDLLNQKTKASITFEDTKTIIRAFETADVSSLVHELGHVFRRDLGTEDLAIAEEWAGVKDGVWTVPAEEKFARGWERYLATGKAPTAELQSIFEKFKKWMSEIYQRIKGSSIDVKITPEIQGVFDRLLIPAEESDVLSQEDETSKTPEAAGGENKILSYDYELGKNEFWHGSKTNFNSEKSHYGALYVAKDRDIAEQYGDLFVLKFKEGTKFLDLDSQDSIKFIEKLYKEDPGHYLFEGAYGKLDPMKESSFDELKDDIIDEADDMIRDMDFHELGGMFDDDFISDIVKKMGMHGVIDSFGTAMVYDTNILDTSTPAMGNDLYFNQSSTPAEGVTLKQEDETDITGLADRNKLKVAISKLKKLKEKDPAKRTATDIKNIKSLEAKKTDIEKLISEGGAFVESLPRAKFKPAEGPVSTRVELRRSIMNARKAMAKGDKAGVQKERARFKDIIKRASTRRKRSTSMKELKAKIKKELKTAKIKKVGGKPVGKFTPEIQDTLNTLISVSKLKPAEAERRIADNLERYSEEAPPQEIIIENHFLEMVARLDTMDSIGGLQDLLDEIKALKDEGRLIKQLRDFNRSEKNRARAEATVEELGGVPEGVKFTGIKDFTPKKVSELAARAIRTLGKTIMGWDDLMDTLSFKTKTKPGESFISRDNNLLGTKNVEKRGTRLSMDTVNADYMEAYQLKKNRHVIRKIHDDNTIEIKLKKVPMTNPIDQTYMEMDLIFTRAELRKRAMEISDPTLEESFKEMGYNENTKAHIFNALTAQDKVFIESQMDFYRDYYDGTNDVYKAIYGVNLPKNDNYSPLMREGVTKPVDAGMGEFMKEMAFRATAASAGALKSRVGSVLTISKASDIAVLERHIAEMEHFKAWAERIRDLNAVWKNQQVRAAVEVNHGKDMLGLVDNFISDIANGATTMGQKLRGLDKLRINFTKSVLAVNPDVTIKQLTSFVAYAEKMPVAQFTKYLLQFWAHPVENMKTIYTSELMKARGTNIERDLKAAMQSQEHSAFKKHQSLTNMLMLNIQIGDQGAIVIGGWAYYKYLMDKKGMTHDQAIAAFEKFTENTQQSGDITEQSYWQRGGSLAKLVTMFSSSPNQYLRKEIGAIRNLAAGRQGKMQTLKTLVIFHALLPMFFQFVSDRFTWDEDEQKRALIFGALNGWFIVGDGLDYVLRKALGMKTFDMELPIYSVFHDFVKASAIVDLFDLSTEEFFRAVRGIAGIAGAATGLPFKQFVDEATGAVDVLDGEYEKGLTELMGYSPYFAKKLSED